MEHVNSGGLFSTMRKRVISVGILGLALLSALGWVVFQTLAPGKAASGKLIKVQYKVGSGTVADTVIHPVLRIVNEGPEAVALDELNLAYWFEGISPEDLQIQCIRAPKIGCDNLKPNLQQLKSALPGADSVLKLGFVKGLLEGNSDSGDIELQIRSKNQKIQFQQSKDYSYNAALLDFGDNDKIALYRKGLLIWGQEPTGLLNGKTDPLKELDTLNTDDLGLQVQYRPLVSDAQTATIVADIILENTGAKDIPFRSISLRYYFTRDHSVQPTVSLEGSGLEKSKAVAKMKAMAQPTELADSYTEITFNSQDMLQGKQFTHFRMRIAGHDVEPFSQLNDYSFSPLTVATAWKNITAYVDGQRAWGAEPH